MDEERASMGEQWGSTRRAREGAVHGSLDCVLYIPFLVLGVDIFPTNNSVTSIL